jgi:hypothetical protein
MAINYNLKVVTTTPYTIQPTDEVVFVNVPTTASVVLPTIAGGKNTAFYIKDYSGNATVNPIFITATGSETINGVSFAILNVNYSHIQLIWDGSNWQTLTN